MTKYILISDLHGNLPSVPEGDVLLIAGDTCPNFLGYKYTKDEAKLQFEWYLTVFKEWISKLPVNKVISTWGNHDIVGEYGAYFPLPIMHFQWAKYYPTDINEKLVILKDAGIVLNDIKIWGTPWSVTFGGNWAFNKPDNALEECWHKIPLDTDILITHGPPYLAGDEAPAFGAFTNRNLKENAGSKTLRTKIEEIQPKLVVCGHIHEGRGFYKIGETLVVNASILDGNYNHVHEPIVWEM